MTIFNLVYKIKKQKLRKVVWWIILKWHFLNKKRFIKSLPSCKYVNPLQRSYLNFNNVFRVRIYCIKKIIQAFIDIVSHTNLRLLNSLYWKAICFLTIMYNVSISTCISNCIYF